MRLWSLPNRTHHFLQQTCVFQFGQSLEDEEDSPHRSSGFLSHVRWSATGKLLAGAVDNLVNIWAVAGQSLLLQWNSAYEIFSVHFILF